jgi:hypothetical protein
MHPREKTGQKEDGLEGAAGSAAVPEGEDEDEQVQDHPERVETDEQQVGDDDWEQKQDEADAVWIAHLDGL